MKLSSLLKLGSIALLGALAFPSCAHPQRTATVGATHDVPSATPLQILDDSGKPITESQIRRKMRPSRSRWVAYPMGFIIGGLIVGVAAPRGPSKDNCSIYEPCSDREKFYRSTSILAGGIIGMIFGGAVVAKKVDRIEAIDMIRQERRSTRP